MSFFSNLFAKKEPPSQLKNLAAIEVDIHSHLVPGIDDGSQSMAESMHLIRLMQNIGFKKIITSPHIMTGGFNNTPAIIRAGRDEVRNELTKQNIAIDFDAYAEYYIDDTIENKIKEGLICINDKLLLVELSYYAKPINLFHYFFQLNEAGYQVILAHPERYPFLYEKDLETYRQIKDMGVLFQLNITSFSGVYGQGAKQYAEKLLAENMIELLGTDLHNEKHFRFLLESLKSRKLEQFILSDKLQNKKLFA